jgi:hypothetical protein
MPDLAQGPAPEAKACRHPAQHRQAVWRCYQLSAHDLKCIGESPENASDVARKTSFGAAGSFQGGRERHPFKIAPDRRPDSLELRPTSRWSAAFAAESRVEVRRPDTQGVAQIVHRGRSEVLAPKQQYGDLERRVTGLGRARSDPEHAFNGSSLSKP